MKFKISGIRNSKHINKTIKADTIKRAHHKAQTLGIMPIEITPIESFCIKSLFSYDQELLLSFQQISFMFKSAIAIDEIIQQCIMSSSHPKIKSMYEDILKSLLQGSSLSSAFSKFSFIIGDLRVAMIGIGESSGNLSEVFEILAQEITQKQKELIEFKKKLFYPCLVFICTFLAFGFLNARVLPEFVKLFEEMSVQLPFCTKALIFSGEFFSKWGIPVLFLMIGMGFFVKKLPRKSKVFREKSHQYFLKVPILGKILLHRDLYRYFLGFYFCEKAGLDIKLSLKNAHSSVNNVFLKTKFEQVGVWIEKGESLSSALCKIGIIDTMVQGLIVSGERSGNLEKILQMAHRHYEHLYSQSLESFSRWLEPLMSVFVGLLVLWFALGILMPMWNLNSAVL
ncbi:type II secretion system F family protein [Helicobacter cappadocius]|uniref:Type II secretion system F family protein n=1 Tax=Helicobacter cappadocius TaxID=3063998 RepID=A0AA90PXA2_9HELI|nr:MULTISPECIES: type II secretion system F family protein [unclassified Helicobacter]MDO7252411.1 type II secretion system F family protein [Helicobacter sp. faydin-H75]MDP2538278.1 type II secretion system F family protein [Helicobacter sp. faydin-H76]